MGGALLRAYRRAMGRALRIAALLVPLLAAGCAGLVDNEQLRVCRLVLPALHPEGTQIRELRSSPTALGHQGVRIDYSAREPGAETRSRFAACGFGGGALDRDRLDLMAVATDSGPLGPARLTYL